MTYNPEAMLTEFHEAFGHAIHEKPDDWGLAYLRASLIAEEAEEVDAELFPYAETAGVIDLEALAKELADLLYVTYGTAVAFGIDITEAFRRVHESNMSKLGDDGKPVVRSDGKVLKGPNYRPPSMEGVIYG